MVIVLLTEQSFRCIWKGTAGINNVYCEESALFSSIQVFFPVCQFLSFLLRVKVKTESQDPTSSWRSLIPVIKVNVSTVSKFYYN